MYAYSFFQTFQILKSEKYMAAIVKSLLIKVKPTPR